MKSKYVPCSKCGRDLLREKGKTVCGNCIKWAINVVEQQRPKENILSFDFDCKHCNPDDGTGMHELGCPNRYRATRID